MKFVYILRSATS